MVALGLMALTALSAGGARAQSKPNFTGTWSTSWGPMELTQSKGGQVQGTYGFAKGGTVKGTVTRDGTWSFEWHNRGSSGEASATLWQNRNGFTGNADGQFFGAYRATPDLPKPIPGKVVTGVTNSLMRVHVRAPRKWKPSKAWPALVILHGSNMTAKDYVHTIASAWPKIAARYVLIGFDGERLSPGATEDALSFNYTYVNFSGEGVGEPGRYNQSPGLLAKAMEEVQQEWKLESFLVGGHSQGGFLTWVMALHFPRLVAGAFPMSCNLIVQCEPDYFDDKKLQAAQRKVPLAVVHGQNDGVVPFSGGTYGYRRMVDGGFPMVRLFDHPTAAHMFALLPVPEAIDWLETMSGGDGAKLTAFAERALKEKPPRTRDALAALLQAKSSKVKGSAKRKLKRLEKDLDETVKEAAAALLPLMKRNENGEWADAFLEFRANYAPSPKAQQVLKVYAAFREQHAKPAEALYRKARNTRDQSARNALYAELVTKYYASKWYEHAREWIQ